MGTGAAPGGFGSGAITPALISASASRPISASAAAISTGICQPQSSRLPNASELLSEWAAMHGYSEPVAR